MNKKIMNGLVSCLTAAVVLGSLSGCSKADVVIDRSRDTASISVIGGADGPTSIFIAGKIGGGADESTGEPESGNAEDEQAESRVRLFQDGTEIVPHENSTFAEMYSKGSWIVGDRQTAASILQEIAPELPEVTLDAGLEIRIPETENVQMSAVGIYDETGSRIMQFQEKGDFDDYCKEMEPGTYYIVVSTIRYGKYIKSADRHERFGYEYAFRLIKPHDSFQPGGGT